MGIQVSAPTRIDLCGGTLDIWPIFLMLKSPLTINIAINVNATVILRSRKDKKISIKSIDSEEEVNFLSIEEVDESKMLLLPTSVVKYFSPKSGFDLEINSGSPRGAGIGGSSSLLIALISAFSRFCNKKLSFEKLIQLARDLECGIIKVPAGIQDYIPAAIGGINLIHLTPGGFKIEKLSISLNELNQRVVLCYTGQPRNSGINNWDVTKKFIDGDQEVKKNLQGIADVSRIIGDNLKKKRFDEVGNLISKEWDQRLKLSPGISTDLIVKTLDAGRSAGAIAGKVCGAGGGGCLFLYCKPNRKDGVTKAISKVGVEIIPFEFVKNGVEVKNAK